MGYAMKGGEPQGTVPASPFWACQPLAGILENETSQVRHISVHSSPSPASSYLHVANGQTTETLKKKNNTRIWNQCMFIPELLGLKLTYKSRLFVKLHTIYLFQVMPKTYLEFFWRLALESLAYSCQYLQQWRCLDLKSKFCLGLCKQVLSTYILNKRTNGWMKQTLIVLRQTDK